MIRTAIYMRVSTDRQVQEGESIPAQRDALMEYIKKHPDMVMVGEYLDDGISGTKYDRDELQRMLQDVKDGMIDLIIVTKMDRLHRSLRNFLNMQDILDKHNCNWIAICEPMYDTSTPQGRMVVNTMMNLAQFEAEQTGQRIKQVFDYKKSKKETITGKMLPGYSISSKTIVKNDFAPAVVDIYEHFRKTGLLRETQRYMRTTYGLSKDIRSVKHMLSSEKYLGIWYGINGFCEPIIDRQLYDDVQNLLRFSAKQSPNHTYIFSGLLVCDECGKRMVGCKKEGAFYYRCRTHYSDNSRCGNTKIMRESVMEKRMIKNIKEQLKDYIIEVEKQKDKPKDNRAKITAINDKISKLLDLYLDGIISKSEYIQRKKDLEKQIELLDSTKTPDVSGLKELQTYNIKELYATFTDEEKRMFWRGFINEIRFTIDRDLITVFL